MKIWKGIAIFCVVMLVLVYAARDTLDENYVSGTTVAGVKFSVVKTGEISAKLVAKNGGEAIDAYEINNIDFEESCSTESSKILGMKTMLLSYSACPTEEDMYDHSKRYILFGVKKGNVQPLVFGKDVFRYGDYDNDGVLEAVTNYDAGGVSRALVYDNIDGEIVCADPEEAMMSLYGLHSKGVHLPYRKADRANKRTPDPDFVDGIFESDSYTGLTVQFEDLEFEKLSVEEIRDRVLAGKTPEYMSNTEPVGKPLAPENQGSISGQFFTSCLLNPSQEGLSGNRIEVASTYEVELTSEGKIKDVYLLSTPKYPLYVTKVWGPDRWNRTCSLPERSYVSQYLHTSYEDWHYQISEDGYSAKISMEINNSSLEESLKSNTGDGYWPEDITSRKIVVSLPWGRVSSSDKVTWKSGEDYVSCEEVTRCFGPYETPLGTVRPVLSGLATVIRSCDDDSVIEVQELRGLEITAPNAEWKGGEFNINQNENGTIRVSSTGQFCMLGNGSLFQRIRRAFTNESLCSEAMTVVVNLDLK